MPTPYNIIDSRVEPEAGDRVVSGAASRAGSQAKPKLMFLVTEDWYFCSHRLPVARAARDAGYEVVVATRVADHGEQIAREGFRLVPLSWRRGSMNPLREIGALREVIALYKREQPDLLHHVAIKPAVYGSIAARAAGSPPVVNMVAGLGYVFTSRGAKPRAMAVVLRYALKRMLQPSNSRLIFQNPDDESLLTEVCRPRPGQMVLIRGSGVDLDAFTPTPEPDQLVATMVSRMLWNKGVGDLVDAAQILRRRGEPVRVEIVGAPDTENPSSIPESQLRDWDREGTVRWSGHRDDITRVWSSSSIAVLPTTYGEGVPKALLEAAASARPIIATDTPGCREIVRDGENGLLVPVHDPGALADAIVRLARDAELRRAMGMRGRRIVEEEFSESLVVKQTMDVYRSLRAAHAE